MRKLLLIILILALFVVVDQSNVAPGLSEPYVPILLGQTRLEDIFSMLSTTKESDLSFCLKYIKKSDYEVDQIAEFITTWQPDLYKRKIPAIFRSKIDRVLSILKRVDYEQLLIDIDLIKNSSLSVNDMVKMIKGTRLCKR